MHINSDGTVKAFKIVGDGRPEFYTIPAGTWQVSIQPKPPQADGVSDWVVLIGTDSTTTIGASVDSFEQAGVQLHSEILFIEDDAEVIKLWQEAFKGKTGMVFAECHSAVEAMDAIMKHQPELLFLGHDLSDGGSEGFKVLKELQAAQSPIEVWALTSLPDVQATYTQIGIGWVFKGDLPGILEIIQKS